MSTDATPLPPDGLERLKLWLALRDLLALWDRRDQGSWTFEEMQRLEEIRAMVANE